MWELEHEEGWVLKKWCFWIVVLGKTLESPLDCKEIRKSILNIHWKDWCWSWSSNTWATWCKEPTHWKRPWCWERLKVGGEGGNRGWDGWIASPTQRTWVWANSGRQWRTEEFKMLRSMGLLRVWHDLVMTEQQQQLTKGGGRGKSLDFWESASYTSPLLQMFEIFHNTIYVF